MNWSDFMRLAGAYAATHRWQEALGEIRQRRNRWQAAPELLYMGAVALARSGQAAGVWQLCRAGLEITGHSRHPERAYWVSRACLVSGRLAPDQAFALEERITHAYPPIAGLLGPAELRGALLLRTGRPREAFDQLTSAGVPRAAGKVALLLVAVAAARSGSRAKASKWLTGADAIRESTIYRHLRPWLDAEAESLREELAASLNQRLTKGDAPTQSSSRSARLATSDR